MDERTSRTCSEEEERQQCRYSSLGSQHRRHCQEWH